MSADRPDYIHDNGITFFIYKKSYFQSYYDSNANVTAWSRTVISPANLSWCEIHYEINKYKDKTNALFVLVEVWHQIRPPWWSVSETVLIIASLSAIYVRVVERVDRPRILLCLMVYQILEPEVKMKRWRHEYKQGKSEGFDSCDRPSNFTQIGFKSLIFQPVWHWNLMDDPEKQ